MRACPWALAACALLASACRQREFHASEANEVNPAEKPWAGLPGPRSPLFGATAPVELTLEAPLKTLFAHKFDGQMGREDFTVDVSVAANGQRFTGKLTVRGNTSIGECPFPKLKLKLADAPEGSLFQHARKVKIGTHCGESGDDVVSQLGRIANEKSPWREATIYETLAAVEVPSLGVRRARITYRDTETGETLVRNAFFLEDIDSLAERYGGTEHDDETQGPWSGNSRRIVGQTNLARLHMAEALVGNWDWAFPLGSESAEHEGQPWNVKVVNLTAGGIVPVPFDFDMASGLNGASKLDQTLTPEFQEGRSAAFRQAVATLLDARATFSKEAVEAGAAHFLGKKDRVLSLVNGAAIDEKGRAVLREHVEAFFEALKPEFLWSPIVRVTETELFSDAALTTSEGCALTKGAPVKILERATGAIRVRMLRTECREEEGWVKAGTISATE